ncbi:MAG: pectate lyase, partial [Verrucomicrobiae bacterium]|nr:pectate lyase [Verrucomicrobiae bacterium]
MVPASPGDATERIQHAIDYVSALAPEPNGLRGAVLLLSGRHETHGSLRIANSGVVLRGQGMNAGGTTLRATGYDRRTLIRVVGHEDRRGDEEDAVAITEDHVPVGATSFHLETTTGLQTGDLVRITRPSTQEWIEFLGATDLGGGVAGWRPGTRDIIWHRTVRAVAGNEITVDAPLTTALERRFGGGLLERCRLPGRLANVGVENLCLESAFDPSRPKDEDHAWYAITFENAADSWARQITFAHFAGSAVAVFENAARITVQDCLSLSPVSENGGHRRRTFFTQGQQTLFLRCFSENGRGDFGVGHCAAGPNAFVQCEAAEALADSGPLESWAGGVLYDDVRIDGNALTLGFRPGNNAAIGWSGVNSVLWNCSASVIRCWRPPGAHNWAFGAWGSFEGDGVWQASNDFVRPDSLFAAQVQDRLGKAAADRLQLMTRSHEGATNPTPERAQELAAIAHTPPPQLRDYIANAFARDPIPDAPGNAPSVDDLADPATPPPTAPVRSRLILTNGWLTVNSRLLIGGTSGVAWWRGTTRPSEAPGNGIAITRFVPGRIGRGLTDDLLQLADGLRANGTAALDHNYGLWYDRRRDDHERTRRIDGEVQPPFFEQPFARSGEGTTWDGLSRYDLTRFNPWYWSRLREFADLCDERGLLLFHQQYFQHNILEAGAHWADFPWRSANNINATGFPEPPPYAGDKRIFQADLFYDVTHPVRRKLHEGYIRQCLDNFAGNDNVIQFTGAEFTGPLHFMEFWLDTISAWERTQLLTARDGNPPAVAHHDISADSCRRLPVIALSATKDVQDAILADPVR